MRHRSIVLLTVLTLSPLLAGSDERHPSDWVRILEVGARDDWPHAIKALLQQHGVPGQAVATLIRRMDAMDGDDRRRFAAGLYRNVVRPATLEAVVKLLADADEKTVRAARKAMNHCEAEFAAPILTAHVRRGHPRRDLLAVRLSDLWYEEELKRRSQESLAQIDLQEDVAAGRTDAIVDVLAPLLKDGNSTVRQAGIRSLYYIGDARVRRAVYPLTSDPEPDVRLAALRLLGYHGDERAYRPLLEWADTAAPRARRWHRNQRFRKVGGLFRHTHFAESLERYRSALGDEQKKDCRALIEGAIHREMKRNPRTLKLLESVRSDPDALIAGVARKVIDWKDQPPDEEPGPGIGSGILVATGLVTALLGFVLFHWAFRLLELRRLFLSLTPAPIRSLASGHVAISGTVRGRRGASLEHPYTGEQCVYYPGADRKHPEMRFTIEDATGEVLVEARDLVLLSEDGIIEEGEKVLLVGTAHRDGNAITMKKGAAPQSLYRRCVHFAVRRLLGGAAESGSARVLFSDPSRCFCLWDDLRERPFACWRDSMTVFGAILITGVWFVVFALAALALLDQELSATLRQTFDGWWNGGA